MTRYGNWATGTKGRAVFGESVAKPALFDAWSGGKDHLRWRYDGPAVNPYQIEHDVLFRSIRTGTKHNDTERCAAACLAGIMGRMAAESGQDLTAEQALANPTELCPGLERLTPDSPAPVQPGADGRYPVAMPGRTLPA
ncbi:MAG: hypothetical protein FJ265_21405 [Planctomycetes bacterium]|nr:hypothetical protein [Planctomycetota bacterium]